MTDIRREDRSVLIPVTLTVRDSTGPPPESAN
jgi:hypothetical protein